VREAQRQFSHPISHRTPDYRMGKDGIDLFIPIKKLPNFRMQRDCKIQDEIDGNSLGNRCAQSGHSAIIATCINIDPLTAHFWNLFGTFCLGFNRTVIAGKWRARRDSNS
jgi:hypothetical protein